MHNVASVGPLTGFNVSDRRWSHAPLQRWPLRSPHEPMSVQRVSCCTQVAYSTNRFCCSFQLDHNSGSLSCTMCRASAHEAQQAAGAIRVADLRPNIPIRMGRVARQQASSFSCGSPGTSRQRLHGSQHASIVQECVLAGLARGQCSQQMVAPRACTLNENLPSSLQIGHPLNCLVSSCTLSATTSDRY